MTHSKADPGSIMKSFDEVEEHPSYILGIRQLFDVVQDFQRVNIRLNLVDIRLPTSGRRQTVQHAECNVRQ